MISFVAMKEGNFLSKRLKDLQIAKRTLCYGIVIYSKQEAHFIMRDFEAIHTPRARTRKKERKKGK